MREGVRVVPFGLKLIDNCFEFPEMRQEPYGPMHIRCDSYIECVKLAEGSSRCADVGPLDTPRREGGILKLVELEILYAPRHVPKFKSCNFERTWASTNLITTKW